MNDFAERIAGLSPDKINLLLQKLNRKKAAAGGILLQGRETDTFPQITGGTLVGETCQNVSPDSPYCEYGVIPAGTTMTAKFVVKVTATRG